MASHKPVASEMQANAAIATRNCCARHSLDQHSKGTTRGGRSNLKTHHNDIGVNLAQRQELHLLRTATLWWSVPRWPGEVSPDRDRRVRGQVASGRTLPFDVLVLSEVLRVLLNSLCNVDGVDRGSSWRVLRLFGPQSRRIGRDGS